MEMFVIVSTYRAKVGEEDAIIALHENWQHNQGLLAKDYLSWELLRKVEAPREFIAIAHYENEESARVAKNNLGQDAWFCRLVSLIEEGPVHTYCTNEWHLREHISYSAQS
ncbi:MAG: hypothetical protein NVSMB33_13340 [Ktedonobacteraceae bacterium]